MNNLKKFLTNMYDKTLDLTAVILSILIMLMVILISIQVICRFLNRPVLFTTEISTYIMLTLGLPGAAWLLRHDGHTYIETVYNLLGKKSQAILDLAKFLLGGVTCFFITWGGVIVTYQQYVRDVRVADSLQTPAYLLLALIPFGTFLLTIEFTRKIMQSIKNLKKVNVNYQLVDK